jgi:ABC-type transport system involved in multi-copper enzyme maturation permease subunit
MLWYKSWLDTRWRFLIGLMLLVLAAAGAVLAYPKVLQLMPMVPTSAGGELGRRIQEAAQLSREYRGYIWSQWFRQTPCQLGTLFAVLLGSGSLFGHGSGEGALFTLSLPVSRSQVVTIRAATGLGQLFAMAIVPSLVLPLLSPAVGESYGIGSALVHGVCLFVAGAVFFSLALLLSTVFTDIWRPLLITCALGVILSLCESFAGAIGRYGIFAVMNGETYFRTGQLPWVGLIAAAAISAALLYGATRSVEQQDF